MRKLTAIVGFLILLTYSVSWAVVINGITDPTINQVVTATVNQLTSSGGETYTESFYVAASATSGDGSSGDPWSEAQFNALTFDTDNAADGNVGPGDVVYFSGRNLSAITIPGSGNTNGVITLDGYATNDSVDVINGDSTSGFAMFDGITDPIDIGSHDYIVIRDFEITDWNSSVTGAISGSGCDHVTVTNCYVHDGDTNAYRGITFLNGTSNSNLLISRNKIHGVPSGSSVGMGTGGSYWDDCRVIENYIYDCVDSIAFTDSDSILIESNVFGTKQATSPEDHIDIKHNNSNFVIRYNNFDDTIQRTSSYGAIQMQRGADHGYFYCNRMENQVAAVFLYGGATGTWGATDDINIWSNLMINGMQGVKSLDSSYGTIGAYRIIGNTIVGNNTGSPATSADTGIKGWDTSAAIVQNNILSDNRGSSLYHQYYIPSGEESDNTSSYNLGYYTGQTATVYWGASGTVNFESHGSNNVRNNPTLTNYKPTSSSTYVNNTGTTPSDSYLPNYTNRITINGETYCNNDGGTCDNLLSFDVALDPSTDWTTIPPTVVTALHSNEGAAHEKGCYVYDED